MSGNVMGMSGDAASLVARVVGLGQDAGERRRRARRSGAKRGLAWMIGDSRIRSEE
jgi:hypothetical protein